MYISSPFQQDCEILPEVNFLAAMANRNTGSGRACGIKPNLNLDLSNQFDSFRKESDIPHRAETLEQLQLRKEEVIRGVSAETLRKFYQKLLSLWQRFSRHLRGHGGTHFAKFQKWD